MENGLLAAVRAFSREAVTRFGHGRGASSLAGIEVQVKPEWPWLDFPHFKRA